MSNARSDLEIERKFLLNEAEAAAFLRAHPGTPIRQAYLSRDPRCEIRVRRKGGDAFLTVKGPRSGNARVEVETPIEPAAADILFTLATGGDIAKVRTSLPLGDALLEVDVYEGALAGLCVAEVESPDGSLPDGLPLALGPEVTADRRFDNAALSDADPAEVLHLARALLATTSDES